MRPKYDPSVVFYSPVFVVVICLFVFLFVFCFCSMFLLLLFVCLFFCLFFVFVLFWNWFCIKLLYFCNTLWKFSAKFIASYESVHYHVMLQGVLVMLQGQGSCIPQWNDYILSFFSICFLVLLVKTSCYCQFVNPWPDFQDNTIRMCCSFHWYLPQSNPVQLGIQV